MNEHRGLCHLSTAQAALFECGAEQPRAAVCFRELRRERLGTGDGAGPRVEPAPGVAPGRDAGSVRCSERWSRHRDHARDPAAVGPGAVCDEPDMPFAATTVIVGGGEAISAPEAQTWSPPGVGAVQCLRPDRGDGLRDGLRVARTSVRDVPIGRPIANAQHLRSGCAAAARADRRAGRALHRRRGVARGYLNRPELTAERSSRDPFSGEAEARMYRTGDLGRWLADGTSSFWAAIDFQVKVRGFRIELGEIEARCSSARGGHARRWSLAREDARRTSASWPMSAASARRRREALRRVRCAKRLPDYMVPAAFVPLEALPLTPNGKIDRKALPGAGRRGVRERAPTRRRRARSRRRWRRSGPTS